MKRTRLFNTQRLASPWRPAALALLLLSGCASTGQKAAPELAIQSAEQAIGNAERARAAESAADELAQARAKLISAQTALRDKQRVQAERLADESRVEAELALARNEVHKARSVNDGLRKGTLYIEQEMHRHQGANE